MDAGASIHAAIERATQELLERVADAGPTARVTSVERDPFDNTRIIANIAVEPGQVLMMNDSMVAHPDTVAEITRAMAVPAEMLAEQPERPTAESIPTLTQIARSTGRNLNNDIVDSMAMAYATMRDTRLFSERMGLNTIRPPRPADNVVIDEIRPETEQTTRARITADRLTHLNTDMLNQRLRVGDAPPEPITGTMAAVDLGNGVTETRVWTGADWAATAHAHTAHLNTVIQGNIEFGSASWANSQGAFIRSDSVPREHFDTVTAYLKDVRAELEEMVNHEDFNCPSCDKLVARAERLLEKLSVLPGVGGNA